MMLRTKEDAKKEFQEKSLILEYNFKIALKDSVERGVMSQEEMDDILEDVELYAIAKSKVNISATLKEALKVLEDLQNICESKNPQKIAERITDEDAGVIGAFTLIDFAMIRNTFAKYESDINGDVKEVA